MLIEKWARQTAWVCKWACSSVCAGLDVTRSITRVHVLATVDESGKLVSFIHHMNNSSETKCWIVLQFLKRVHNFSSDSTPIGYFRIILDVIPLPSLRAQSDNTLWGTLYTIMIYTKTGNLYLPCFQDTFFNNICHLWAGMNRMK